MMKHRTILFMLSCLAMFLFTTGIVSAQAQAELEWNELDIKTTVQNADGSRSRYSIELKVYRDNSYAQVEVECNDIECKMDSANRKVLEGCSINTLKVYADPSCGVRFTLSDPTTGKVVTCTPTVRGITSTVTTAGTGSTAVEKPAATNPFAR